MKKAAPARGGLVYSPFSQVDGIPMEIDRNKKSQCLRTFRGDAALPGEIS